MYPPGIATVLMGDHDRCRRNSPARSTVPRELRCARRPCLGAAAIPPKRLPHGRVDGGCLVEVLQAGCKSRVSAWLESCVEEAALRVASAYARRAIRERPPAPPIRLWKLRRRLRRGPRGPSRHPAAAPRRRTSTRGAVRVRSWIGLWLRLPGKRRRGASSRHTADRAWPRAA